MPYSYSKIRHQVASGEGSHGRVTALIRSHYIDMSPCSTNQRVGSTTHRKELPSLSRRPRQIAPWVGAPDGDRASLEYRGNSSGGLLNQKFRLHIGPGYVVHTRFEGTTGRDRQHQIVQHVLDSFLRADRVDPYTLTSMDYCQFTGHGKDCTLDKRLGPLGQTV